MSIRSLISSLWKRLPARVRLALSVLGTLGILYVAGFVIFAGNMPEKPVRTASADGIVVLTGGPERIDAAFTLLAEGKGSRLLVSGVHPDVTRERLRELVTGDDALFDCCVDIDWRAENTIGNAAETAPWAQANGFSSLIVVTSAYHLPRALRELRHTMPEMELTGHPVFHDGVHLDDWWRYPKTSQLLLGEYSKYLLTLVRLGGLEET